MTATAVVAAVLLLLVVRALSFRQSPRTVVFNGVVTPNFSDAVRLRVKAVAQPMCHPDPSSWTVKWLALSAPSYVVVEVHTGGSFKPTLIYERRTGGLHPPLA